MMMTRENVYRAFPVLETAFSEDYQYFDIFELCNYYNDKNRGFNRLLRIF